MSLDNNTELYTTVKGEGTLEFEEKRSLFICHGKHVTSEEDAMEFVKAKKKEFADATHNCWAYILKGGIIARYSDDGEPQGTAGVPMLEVIVMLIGLRTETYLLHFNFHLLRLLLFLALLHLVKELRVLNQTANRRVCSRRNLHKVKFFFFCKCKSLVQRHYYRFNIISHNTHLFGTNLFVYTILVLQVVVLH